MSDASPTTITIKVIARHGTKCKRENPDRPSDWKECNCRKSLYINENGKDRIESAKTRSSERAEQIAQAERDKRDPDKQRIKELEEQLATKEKEAPPRSEPQSPSRMPPRVVQCAEGHQGRDGSWSSVCA